jgi:Cysteine-rich CPCC
MFCAEEYGGEGVNNAIDDSGGQRCPCCRYKTLRGRGQFELCPVCFWEDDDQDEPDADLVRGGPNAALSLRQAQINFANFGACEQSFANKVRGPLTEEL